MDHVWVYEDSFSIPIENPYALIGSLNNALVRALVHALNELKAGLTCLFYEFRIEDVVVWHRGKEKSFI